MNNVLSEARRAGLEKNFKRMFWISALQNVRVINIVSTLFYLHRGLTIEQVFYLAIVFSVINILFEVPSSYLADRWGRKKTILLAVALLACEKIIYFTADSFTSMVFALATYACAFSLFSGTDDALVYDSAKELGVEKESVVKLGAYYSAQRMTKMFTPLIGALIAKDLLDWQFDLIIVIDLLTVAIGLIAALKLVEPHHQIDVLEHKKGVFLDALTLLRTDPILLRTIVSRTLIFVSSFLVWRMHQVYFTDLGISIVMIGLAMCIIQGIGFWLTRKITEQKNISVSKEINKLNLIYTGFLILFFIASFMFAHPWLMLVLYVLFITVEPVRWPLYSEVYNKRSHSFNRATTLSLSNLFKSFFDIPILLIGAWLVSQSPIYLFAFCALLGVIAVIYFTVPRQAIEQL